MENLAYAGVLEDTQARKDLPTGMALSADPEAVGAEQAQAMLQQLADTIRELARRELESRLFLGRLLLGVQDRGLFMDMKPAYATWTDFLEQGFPTITGLRVRTAYDAMELAKSQTLKEISPEDRAEIPLSNARTLVRLEKATPKRRLPVETIQKAKTMPNDEFRREVGASRGYNMAVWVEDKRAGRQIQRIAEALRTASEDAARNFADLLESIDVTKRAGDGIDNKIDLILATCKLAWQNEEAEMDAAESVDLRNTSGTAPLSANFADADDQELMYSQPREEGQKELVSA